MKNNNPILRNLDNVSPAESIGILFNDENGELTAIDFRINDIVISESGRMYRVEGFTYDNKVIVTQHGLNSDPLVHSLQFEGQYLRHLPREEDLMYKDGLVIFVN